MAYKRVNWTEMVPINSDNLNKMDEGIKNLDDNKLDNTHPSSKFAYNSETGRITHGGNDVKVLNSVNAENTTKVNNMIVRGGSGLTGASGYITYSW